MGFLRVLKGMIFSDPDGAATDRGRRPSEDEHERRDDGSDRRGMTKDQFFTELEKLTEAE